MAERRTTTAGPPTRRRAALTALLALGLFLALARLADRHLSWRVDLSEDQLAGWSPAAVRVLERLDDLLAIELFLTGDPEHAAAQLHRRRVLDAFEELEELGDGRVRLVVTDPGASYTDRLRAQRLGIAPVPIADWAGTSRVSQEVWFGAVLRYRGDEEVIGFLDPTTLEYEVASAAHRLAAQGRPRVGWMLGRVPAEDDGPARPDADFDALRAHLARRFELVDVFGLDSGVRPPADLDALVLVAPRDLAPRAAFEVEEFVRSGRALLVLGDRSRADEQARRLDAVETGLEELLAAWGAPVSDQVVWDRTFAYKVQLQQTVGGATRTLAVDYPLWLLARGAEAFDQTSPVTARLPAVLLRWAHPVEAAQPPDGVRRHFLVRSSPDAFAVPVLPEIRVDGAAIEATTRQLIAGREPARSHDIAVALEGVFPPASSAERGPLAVDPTSGEPVPGTDRARRAGAAEPSRVVVVGDADWARDGAVAGPEGLGDLGRFSAALLDNLVDWLVQEDELVALRARVPRDRRLVDLEARALAEEGVAEAEGVTGMSRRAERARARARSERRLWTAASLGGSLALVAAIAALAWWRRRAPTLVPDPAPAPNEPRWTART